MSDQAVKITQTFNGRVEWGIAGEYFKLMAAPAALDVELWNGGRKVLDALACDAGFYQRVPFDKIVLTNGVSQATSFLAAGDQGGSDRFTGTFTAQGTLGTLAQQLIGGVNELVVMERGFAYGAAQKSTAALAAGGTEQVFAAASNPNGAIVWEAEFSSQCAAGQTTAISLNAHTAAPAAFTDGDPYLGTIYTLSTAAGLSSQVPYVMPRPRFVPAGKGLWWINSGGNLETVARRRVLYTLL